MDANITSELILNVFTPNTPLHDGALVVRGNKIKAAACFLPLSDNPNLSSEMGTRHRAAIGMTEVSDSIAVIVSEETGKISIAQGGKIERGLDIETLRKILCDVLPGDEVVVKKLHIWKVKSR
jgi:diadenylate cyclase